MRVGILGHLLSFESGYRQAGVSRYTEHLIRSFAGLQQSNERFVIYAGEGAAQLGKAAVAPSLEWVSSRLPTEKPLARILWEQALCPPQLIRDRIDLLHAPVNVLPLLGSRPAVVTVHDLAFLVYPEQYPGAKQRYLNLLTRLSVRRAKRVIAVSENTARDLQRFYGLSRRSIVVVPNGLDREFAPVTDVEELERFRRDHQLPERFVLFVGTLQPRKNLIGLLRAWAGIDAERRLPLVVVGAPGWHYEPVFDEARRLGIADTVQFAGYAEPTQLRYWYSAATLFAYPSLYEGFGLPVLEAMACGVPVVTSSTSSLPEVAGDAALLVDPVDVDGLRSAIQRLTEDAALRAQQRARGLQWARTFSWQRTARETLEVYRAAMAASGTVAVRA